MPNKHERHSESKVVEFRKKNFINPSESLNLNSLLRTLKVITVFKPLGNEKFSGLAIKSGDLNFMLINSDHTIGRQNFTICHELYHLFAQDDFNYQVCNTGQYDNTDPEEYRADLFASFLLLPEELILSRIPITEYESKSISLDTIVDLEQLLRCSRSALLRRLIDLRILDKNESSSFWTSIIKSARERGGNLDLYRPDQRKEVLGDYGFLANKGYSEGLISYIDYVQMMHDIGIDVTVSNAQEDQDASL